MQFPHLRPKIIIWNDQYLIGNLQVTFYSIVVEARTHHPQFLILYWLKLNISFQKLKTISLHFKVYTLITKVKP